jgi:hypothetical protein
MQCCVHCCVHCIEYDLFVASSPPQLHTGESPPSGSDFEADREARRRQREFYRSRGKSVSDTEEEDNEDEQRLEEELELDTVVEHAKSPPRFTAQQKGKAKAKPPVVDEDPADANEEDEDADEGEDVESSNRRGPLPTAAVREAMQLGRETRKLAEMIAKKYGKPVRSVMISAGLAIQNAREPNFSNLWKVWYAHHHPAPDGSKICHSSQLVYYLIVIEFQWSLQRIVMRYIRNIGSSRTIYHLRVLLLTMMHVNQSSISVINSTMTAMPLEIPSSPFFLVCLQRKTNLRVW